MLPLAMPLLASHSTGLCVCGDKISQWRQRFNSSLLPQLLQRSCCNAHTTLPDGMLPCEAVRTWQLVPHTLWLYYA